MKRALSLSPPRLNESTLELALTQQALEQQFLNTANKCQLRADANQYATGILEQVATNESTGDDLQKQQFVIKHVGATLIGHARSMAQEIKSIRIA